MENSKSVVSVKRRIRGRMGGRPKRNKHDHTNDDHQKLGKLEKRLFDAIEDSDPQEVEKLISMGVDVNADFHGRKWDFRSPLSLAIVQKDKDIIILLLQAGARYHRGDLDVTIELLKFRGLWAVALRLIKSMSRVSDQARS